jgi:predicted phosphodiesterase
MRIAVIGDVHANLPALRAVLDDIASIAVDAVYGVGDLVGRGPHPNEVIDEVRRAGILFVQGNWDEAVGMDRPAPGCTFHSAEDERAGVASLTWTQGQVTEENASFLRQLPTVRREQFEGRSVLFFHGTPLRQSDYLSSDLPSRVFARIAEDEADDLFCFGHSHDAFHRELMESHFVGVGAVGCWTEEQPRARYAVIFIGSSEIVAGFRAVSYDATSTVRDLAVHGLEARLMGPVPGARRDGGGDRHVARSWQPGGAPSV